eukprot:43919-Chlamydomonas_euryale.AAC.2
MAMAYEVKECSTPPFILYNCLRAGAWASTLPNKHKHPFSAVIHRPSLLPPSCTLSFAIPTP